MIGEAFGLESIRSSGIYQTSPVGGPSGQQLFLNAVVAITTEDDTYSVWNRLRQIESDLGRQRQVRWEARRIDLDILLAGSERIWTPHLKIPHPRMSMRRFLLIPASEVADDWIEPTSGLSIRNLVDHVESVPRRAIVIGEKNLIERLRNACNDSIKLQENELLEFMVWNEEFDWSKVGNGILVAAVASPDPETVAWEDVARPWAKRLGIVESTIKMKWNGPRYILPSHDISWAVHELQAIFIAMTCPAVRLRENLF